MTNETNKKRRWLELCKICGKKHFWTMGLCPSCGVYEVPRLISEEACFQHEECDGCMAYREHMG